MKCDIKHPYNVVDSDVVDTSTPFAYYDYDTDNQIYTARSQAIDWYVHLENHIMHAIDCARKDIKGAENLSITQNKNIVTNRIDVAETNLTNRIDEAETNLTREVNEAESNVKSHVTTKSTEVKNHVTTKTDEVKTHVTNEKNSLYNSISGWVTNILNRIQDHTVIVKEK